MLQHKNELKSMMLCSRKMDRETTRKLLRESIVFLCKTHLGQDACGGFEVDAIICVSRHRVGNKADDSHNDPRPIVFKFHELVTDEESEAVEENVNEWLLSGSDQSFMNGLVRQSDQLEPPANKKRKLGDRDANQAYDRVGTDSVNVPECTPDLNLVKQEPDYSNTDVKSNAENDTCAEQTQSTRRLRSADAGCSRNHAETAIAKALHSTSRDPRTAAGITELEKLVSNPVMSSPPPLKLIPGTAEPRQCSNDEFPVRPASQNTNNEDRPDTVADEHDESLDESANGIEQSTPRSCDLCGLLFADFPTFNVHCATLHGRYACPFCALLFPCESTRERHLFEHTGEPVDDDGLMSIQSDGDTLLDTGISGHPSLQSEFGKQQADYWSADSSGLMEMSGAEDSMMAVNGTLYDPQVMTRRGVLSCQTLRAIAQLDPSHPFVCDVCRTRFASSSELCDHCTSAHHRIPCPYCGRSFSQKASMERHQRQHTGERPYQCTLCDSSYTRKENLQTHMSRMHGASSVPDFICVE